MEDYGTGYILTEMWSALPSWLALSRADRQAFFDEKIGPYIGTMVAEGAEFLACAVNDNDGDAASAYSYMAVWKLPNKAFADTLQAGSRETGFLDYFDQANFSGVMTTPPVMNGHMIDL